MDDMDPWRAISVSMLQWFGLSPDVKWVGDVGVAGGVIAFRSCVVESSTMVAGRRRVGDSGGVDIGLVCDALDPFSRVPAICSNAQRLGFN